MPVDSSLSKRRMENSDQYKTTDSSINGQSPINTPFPSSQNSSMTWQERNYFQNSMSDGDTTMSTSKKEINGKQHLKPMKASLSQ